MRLYPLLTTLLLASTAGLESPARAEERQQPGNGSTRKWTWTPPGETAHYGHAERIVSASQQDVLATLGDFARYKSFAPWRFRSSRIVGRRGPAVDVRVEIAALGGLVTLWGVVRFDRPQAAEDAAMVLEGHGVEGNIDPLRLVWTVRPLDGDRVLLSCDLLVQPGVPVPSSVVDDEVRDAAEQAVDGAARLTDQRLHPG